MTTSTENPRQGIEKTDHSTDVRADADAPDAAFERETTVTMSDGDPLVRIWTCQRTTITRLRKKPEAFREVASGHDGTREWAEFTIPAERFNLARGAKGRRTLTEEQREQLAERARKTFGYPKLATSATNN